MYEQEEREEQTQKKRRGVLLFLLLLIIFIIIILLLVRRIGFIDHKMLIPTGNVDIFDIIFKKDCDNNKDCNCTCNDNCNNFDNPITSDKPSNSGGNSNNGGSSSSNGGSGNNTSDEEEKPTDPLVPEEKKDVEVFDDTTVYSENTTLDIFNSSTYYVANNKIAPTSENSYQFVIRNNNEFSIKYSLTFAENSTHDIDMRYRLKLNNEYIAGSDSEWLSLEDIEEKIFDLAANTYDVYTLDWKWFEGDNDTEVGSAITSSYNLQLYISAQIG